MGDETVALTMSEFDDANCESARAGLVRSGSSSMATAVPRFTIIEAPSVLGLFSRGVELLPDALLAAGFGERLQARHTGRVEPPQYDDRRDPETKLLNPRGIVSYSVALANVVGRAINDGDFPIVLGGDCSIMLGCLLALRRRGRYGLLFLDGHADFYQPETEPNGEVASMELALATGRGPAVVSDLEGRRPLVRDEDVVAFGYRDGEYAAAHGSQRIEDSAINVIDLAEVRERGTDEAIHHAIQTLSQPEVAGFWVHLDADVLDDAVMPAVDYRMPGGLSWEELIKVLQAAIGSGRVVGLDVTIFNPKLDEDGTIAAAFVDTLVEGLKF